jgi:hypothetical protein
VKAFLENFAAIVGSISVALLAMSVSHEYGYFWSIGSQFQTFLTTTDYLANGVLWLPLAVLFLYGSGNWWRLKDEEVSAAIPKRDWRNWKSWIEPGIGFAIFGTATAFFSWPLNYFSAISALGIALIAWSKIWRSWIPSKDKIEEPFWSWVAQLVRLGPPVVIGMFLYGSVDAGNDLARVDQPYVFRLKKADHNELRIFLRNFDRGVLVRDAISNMVEFYKWEDVESIGRPAPQKSRTVICWITGLMCNPGPVFEP